ncbi:Protein of unknown function [Bacillus wiedmannii]|nr:Protein of unknown function [Bacillus wiedmannii]
MVRDMKV